MICCAIARLMFARFESCADMIRWSLVEQEYEKDIFAETAWRPQLAIVGGLTAFMQRRIDAGEFEGDAQKLAMVFLGLIFMHALGQQEVSGFAAPSGRSAMRRCTSTLTSFSMGLGTRNGYARGRSTKDRRDAAKGNGAGKSAPSDGRQPDVDESRPRPRKRIIFAIVAVVVIAVALIWGLPWSPSCSPTKAPTTRTLPPMKSP